MTPTPDQIRAMPAGPELDRIAAEAVMGWMLTDYTGLPHCWWTNEEYRLRWTPSTNIADAWELVNVISRDFELTIYRHDERWSVLVARSSDATQVTGSDSDIALAITRAAILAKMGER